MNNSPFRYHPPIRFALFGALVCIVVAVGIGSALVPGSGSHPSSDPAPEVGHRAPDFTLPLLGGRTLHMRSLRGKVVLINFWATWCIPCRAEMPRLASWYQRYRSNRLIVLGIDKQEPSNDVSNFMDRFHVTYPLGIDDHGSILDSYRVTPLPASFLVDSSGIIRSIRYGPLDETYLSSTLLPLFHRR